MHAWEGCVPGTPTHRDRAAEVAWEWVERGVVTELQSLAAPRNGKHILREEEEERTWCVGPPRPRHSVCCRCRLFGAEVWAGAWLWLGGSCPHPAHH